MSGHEVSRLSLGPGSEASGERRRLITRMHTSSVAAARRGMANTAIITPGFTIVGHNMVLMKRRWSWVCTGYIYD